MQEWPAVEDGGCLLPCSFLKEISTIFLILSSFLIFQTWDYILYLRPLSVPFTSAPRAMFGTRAVGCQLLLETKHILAGSDINHLYLLLLKCPNCLIQNLHFAVTIVSSKIFTEVLRLSLLQNCYLCVTSISSKIFTCFCSMFFFLFSSFVLEPPQFRRI